MIRLKMVLCLGGVLLAAAVGRADPIRFEYALQGTAFHYSPSGPLPAGATIAVSNPANDFHTATDAADIKLTYTVTSTAPFESPSRLGVVGQSATVLNLGLIVQDTETGNATFPPGSGIYLMGSVWDGGRFLFDSTDFLNPPGGPVPFWLGPDHQYTVSYDFTSANATGTGELDVHIRATAVPQPPAVPEPATAVLAGVGLAAAGWFRRKVWAGK